MLFGRKRKSWLQGQTWVMMKTWIFQSPAVRKWQCIHFAAQWAISSAFVKKISNPSTDAFNPDLLINYPASLYQLPVHSQQPPVYVSPNQVPQVNTVSFPVPSTFVPPPNRPRKVLNPSPMADFSKFLLRKDFLLTRFTLIVQKVLTRRVHRSTTLCPNLVSPRLRKWTCPWNGSDQTIQSLRVHCVLLTHRTQHWDASRIDCLEDTAGRKWWNILNAFPNLTNKDNAKLFDLVDMLTDVKSTMANPQYTVLLSYFNSPCIYKASG